MSATGNEDLKMKSTKSVRQSPRRPSGLRAGTLLAAAVMLAACAATPAGPDDTLVKRSQARWDAILARDYDTAYALYSPGYRSTRSRTDFEIEIRSHRIRWTKATYRSHTCEGQVCTVKFEIEYEAPRPVPGISKWDGKGTIEDTWIQSSGEWWYVPPER